MFTNKLTATNVAIHHDKISPTHVVPSLIHYHNILSVNKTLSPLIYNVIRQVDRYRSVDLSTRLINLTRETCDKLITTLSTV